MTKCGIMLWDPIEGERPCGEPANPDGLCERHMDDGRLQEWFRVRFAGELAFARSLARSMTKPPGLWHVVRDSARDTDPDEFAAQSALTFLEPCQ